MIRLRILRILLAIAPVTTVTTQISAAQHFVTIGVAAPTTLMLPVPTFTAGYELRPNTNVFFGFQGGISTNLFQFIAIPFGFSHVMGSLHGGFDFWRIRIAQSATLQFSHFFGSYFASGTAPDGGGAHLGTANITSRQLFHSTSLGFFVTPKILIFAGIGYGRQIAKEESLQPTSSQWPSSGSGQQEWNDAISSAHRLFHLYVDQYKVNLGVISMLEFAEP